VCHARGETFEKEKIAKTSDITVGYAIPAFCPSVIGLI
jgi:hypothetical protein